MSFTSEITDEGVLVVERHFVGLPVRLLWKAWREDWHLQGWWAESVKMEFRTGGKLLLGWPSMGYELRGRFTEIVTEKRIAFTWNWSHDPEEFPLHTTLHFLEADGPYSTCLRIEQRAFIEDKDGEEVVRLLEGWEHFLDKLESYVSQMTLV
jgi:uncharacterized protein YndB with AHSA1/START domain